MRLSDGTRIILGIGLGRTGTTSLTRAMRMLGFKTMHNPVTLLDVREHEFTSDIFVASRYRFLDHYYGNRARFILTTRDLDEWVESSRWHAARKAGHKRKDGSVAGSTPMRCESRYYLYGITHFDEGMYRQSFIRHWTEVHELFAGREDRLLVMDVCGGDGWDKLCPFVEREIPDKDFPHRNRRQG